MRLACYENLLVTQNNYKKNNNIEAFYSQFLMTSKWLLLFNILCDRHLSFHPFISKSANPVQGCNSSIMIFQCYVNIWACSVVAQSSLENDGNIRAKNEDLLHQNNKPNIQPGIILKQLQRQEKVCHRLIPATTQLRSNTPDYPSINLQRPPNNSHMTASK